MVAAGAGLPDSAAAGEVGLLLCGQSLDGAEEEEPLPLMRELRPLAERGKAMDVWRQMIGGAAFAKFSGSKGLLRITRCSDEQEDKS